MAVNGLRVRRHRDLEAMEAEAVTTKRLHGRPAMALRFTREPPPPRDEEDEQDARDLKTTLLARAPAGCAATAPVTTRRGFYPELRFSNLSALGLKAADFGLRISGGMDGSDDEERGGSARKQRGRKRGGAGAEGVKKSAVGGVRMLSFPSIDRARSRRCRRELPRS